MSDAFFQPDPLSPEAQAILDGRPYARVQGEFTAEAARAMRAAQATARMPVVAEVAERLGVTVAWRSAGGVEIADVRPSPRPGTTIGHALFLHGGGWVGGLANDMTSVLMADALGLPVLSVNYALAPEARFPVALEQAVTAYRALTEEIGGKWVVFGVSAGANLALGLTCRILSEGLPAPLALGLFTPCTDLTGNGDSRTANDGRDPVLRYRDEILGGAMIYAGDEPLDHPLLSPIYADFDATFPPAMLTTGTRDVFLSDCTRLYWKLRRAGAQAELRVWENLWHAFNTQHHVPEAAEARAEMATFLRAALKR